MVDVSIIIPCYNQENYIIEAVNSVYNQETSLSFEVIVVDDCSTDNSVNAVKGLGEQITKHIILKKNSKLPAVRNAGIKEATGRFLICLDGDDIIPPNYIEENYNTLIEHNVDVCYTPSQCFGAKEVIYMWHEFSEESLKTGNFIHAAAMYKKEIWEKVGGYNEELIYGCEDYEFWIRAHKAGYKFKWCQSTVLGWRQHQDKSQMTQSTTKDNVGIIKQQLRQLHPDFYTR